jgi:hypothetical protein
METTASRVGKTVRITGGMTEFVGKLGTIERVKGELYRVRLHEPVEAAGVGRVRDDLWEGGLLLTIRRSALGLALALALTGHAWSAEVRTLGPTMACPYASDLESALGAVKAAEAVNRIGVGYMDGWAAARFQWGCQQLGAGQVLDVDHAGSSGGSDFFLTKRGWVRSEDVDHCGRRC